MDFLDDKAVRLGKLLIPALQFTEHLEDIDKFFLTIKLDLVCSWFEKDEMLHTIYATSPAFMAVEEKDAGKLPEYMLTFSKLPTSIGERTHVNLILKM